jgi:hypothetical protein
MMFKEFAGVARPSWIGKQWDDNSWHNDAMPHATLELGGDTGDDPTVSIWVNFPDVADRELHRDDTYGIVFSRVSSLDGGENMLYSGSDEHAARQWVMGAEMAKTIIAEIRANPALLRARSFSELHDLCDANVLGAQVGILMMAAHALKEAGITGEDERDALALAAVTDLLNHAQTITDLWLGVKGGV